MFSVIGYLVGFGLIGYIVIVTLIQNSKRIPIGKVKRDDNAIHNLYLFVLAMGILFATLIFSDLKVTSGDAIYIFEFVLIAVVTILIVRQVKQKSSK